jgi:hypothetical protein
VSVKPLENCQEDLIGRGFELFKNCTLVLGHIWAGIVKSVFTFPMTILTAVESEQPLELITFKATVRLMP